MLACGLDGVPGPMAWVTNARACVQGAGAPASVLEVQAVGLPRGWQLHRIPPRRWVLRLLDASLNMEPFEVAVLDGMLRAFSLNQPGPGRVECWAELEWASPPPVVQAADGVPARIRLHFDREPLRAVLRGLRVVVDPAHGGHDRGARGPINLQESHVVLKVARHLAGHLEEAGCRVWMTRSGDCYIPASKRLEFATDMGADVVVCLHMGHQGGPDQGGSRTWFQAAPQRDPDDAAHLAHHVQAALLERLGLPDRGVRELPTPLPWPPGAQFLYISVEPLCLPNPYEEAFLRSITVRDRIAQAIRNGLARFVDQKRQITDPQAPSRPAVAPGLR